MILVAPKESNPVMFPEGIRVPCNDQARSKLDSQDRQTGVPAFLERMKSAGYMYVESWVQDEHGEDFHLFGLKRRESTAPS